MIGPKLLAEWKHEIATHKEPEDVSYLLNVAWQLIKDRESLELLPPTMQIVMAAARGNVELF